MGVENTDHPRANRAAHFKRPSAPAERLRLTARVSGRLESHAPTIDFSRPQRVAPRTSARPQPAEQMKVQTHLFRFKFRVSSGAGKVQLPSADNGTLKWRKLVSVDSCASFCQKR